MMIQFTQGYKTDKGTGDGGIDLVGEYRGRKVNGSLVRDFIGGLSNYPPDTLGIFVTSTGCSQSSLELAESSDYLIHQI
ncbi:hypothetical protein RhiirA4_407446 [Rhizophagus irregularis]|uniref:Restriction endonuclease type IV Mrr domain-containing protein n=1 Tax=Rhizophagus irregularis TaxID=588596 RepID=A0A2I1GXT2_9GLOM|nr:hypothetical protein RhiirA4_407446 [Rhizophagus irregularis]